MYQYESEHEQEIFEYLDELRDSGETNMFGARPYVMSEFEMEKREASMWCAKWRETFAIRFPDV